MNRKAGAAVRGSSELGDFGTCTRARALQNYSHSAQKIGKQRICGRVLAVSGGPQRLVILSTRYGCCAALTDACKKHVSPFLRKLAKLSPLNLQDAPYLAFFLTQS